MRFTSVVLPAPVGPTIAIDWPGSAVEREVLDERRLGVVAERDVLEDEAVRLVVGSGSSGSTGSGTCSSASSSSKTRSALATPDCSRFAIEPSWLSGWVNWREYWMNACTSPRRMRARGDHEPADDGDGDVDEVPDEHHGGHDDAAHELGAEARVVELVVLVVEAALDLAAAAEHLHERVARVGLLDLRVELAGVLPLGDEELLRALRDDAP